MPEKCPYCGAERCKIEPLTHVYVCGSSEHLRNADCYEREIQRQRIAIENLNDAIGLLIAEHAAMKSVLNMAKQVTQEALDDGK